MSTSYFLPYGGYRYPSTPPPSELTDKNFTGQKENSYIKLIYMNARWYDSQIGRFVSADTIVPQTSNPQAFNRYSYVYNNVLNLVDPSGHCAGDPSETHSNPDRECWNLLTGLENNWGIDIQDASLWELSHLQTLSDILEQYANFVGGVEIWKGILAESAQNAGNEKFIVKGVIHDGTNCDPSDGTGCSNSGIVSFNLGNTFEIGRATSGSDRANTSANPFAARATIAHEFTHILFRILPDSYDSDYVNLRGWHDTGGNWVAANGANPMYRWPEGPQHHLVHAIALYVAGNNTWDMVSAQDRAMAGRIPPSEQRFIEFMNLGITRLVEPSP